MNLTFAGWSWLLPAVAFVATAAAILVWAYWGRASAPIRIACGLLKLLGIVALALCLLEPLRSGQRARPGANLFAVVADNSQGLQIRDAGTTTSRGETLRDWLIPRPDDWQSGLAENFDVRRYLFDTRLQGVTDFGELTFDGRSSAIFSSLRQLVDRLKGRPLAGILLFTDGNATDLPSGNPDLTGLPPVYPVVVGRPDAVRDVSINRVTVNQTAFEDQPVVLQVEAAAPGFRGQRLEARVRDQSGQTVVTESATVRRDDEPVPLRLQPKPGKGGLEFYELRLSSGPDGASAADAGSTSAAGVSTGPGTAAGEATLANNTRVLAVDRGQGPYRILYVGGRPNWEYKFLNRALAADAQLQLVALLRVARREPKFEFRAYAGETSNPLFRGFGNQSPEEIERYDQPVLVRLNTRDELELRSGFPRTPEDLYGFHAVILDDVEAAFFGADQALLLQRFVSERGGGMLMLGGMESFRDGGYHRTPIGDLLPVYLDRAPDVSSGLPVRFALAREGWLQPWARLRQDEVGERQRLEGMPPFQVANQVRGIKPGASVIATARDEKNHELPALVTQRFGRGRTGAVLIGDLWRWGMQDPAAREDLEKAWRQLVRWLVTDVPPRIELTVEPIPGDPLGTVELQVRVRDAKFEPLDNATVGVRVEPVLFGSTNAPATNLVHLRAEPAPGEGGLYRATFVPRLTAGFRATASVSNDTGVAQGHAEAGWSSDPAADEFRSLVPNVQLLERLARQTGGQVLQIDDLQRLVRELPNRPAPIMETWSTPAWHTALLFGLALACFVTEWALRRWKGLP